MVYVQNETSESVPNSFFETRAKVIQQELVKDLGEIYVYLITNEEIQKINKEYRNIDAPTDVLSFPYTDDNFLVHENNVRGELFISLEKVREQATEYEVSFESELSKMFVHGVLHLLGYDHIEESDYIEMKKMEEKIAQALGENI